MLSLTAAARVTLPLLRGSRLAARTFFGPCVVLTHTGVPCPFCGATRSLDLALDGACFEALALSPIGPLAVLGSLGLSAWMLAAAACGRELGLGRVARAMRRAGCLHLTLAGLLWLWLWVVIAHQLHLLSG